MYLQLPERCYKQVALHVVAFLLSHTFWTSSYSRAGSSLWASSPSPPLICSRCIIWGSIKDCCQPGQLSGIQIENQSNLKKKPLYQESKINLSRAVLNFTLTASVRFRVECTQGRGKYFWVEPVCTSGSPVLLCSSAEVWGIFHYTPMPFMWPFFCFFHGQTQPLNQLFGAYIFFAVIFNLNVANFSTECCCWLELACFCIW